MIPAQLKKAYSGLSTTLQAVSTACVWFETNKDWVFLQSILHGNSCAAKKMPYCIYANQERIEPAGCAPDTTDAKKLILNSLS